MEVWLVTRPVIFSQLDTAQSDLWLFYAMQTVCSAAGFDRHLKGTFDEFFSSAIQKSVLNPC